MSKLNISRRTFNTVFRQSTIVHPEFQTTVRDPKTGRIIGYNQVTLNDHVNVRTIDTHGSFPIRDMVAPDVMARMAGMYSRLSKSQRR